MSVDVAGARTDERVSREAPRSGHRVQHADVLERLAAAAERIAAALEREEARRGVHGLLRVRRDYPDEYFGRNDERPLRVVR
ncbi:MAG: hypothetical protein ABL963_12240 [Longimicrobiales bacterium]